MEEFANKITKLCFDKYKNLNKTGKPTDKEWTVLSGIVLKINEERLILTALATGTKCLGQIDLINTEIYDTGCRISDSHAEVLARRAFLRYLYDQIDLVLSDSKSDVFVLDDQRKIILKDGISFHFFSSQTPCGDCSIFPKDNLEDYVPSAKIKKYDVTSVPCLKEEHSVNKDIHRTGAKCVTTEEIQDPRLSGVNYHVTGPLRTKPGRGNPTLSLSCSDKIAKWNVLGLQGCLLSQLIPQINIETITIGGKCPFSLEAMERGIYTRFKDGKSNLRIMQSTQSFIHKKGFERTLPCPTSIVWCAVRNRNTEIIVEGRKQGATKKKRGNSPLVSRRALFKNFLITCDKYKTDICSVRHPKRITYFDCKQLSISYQRSWLALKKTSFSAWPSKPLHLQTFTL